MDTCQKCYSFSPRNRYDGEMGICMEDEEITFGCQDACENFSPDDEDE